MTTAAQKKPGRPMGPVIVYCRWCQAGLTAGQAREHAKTCPKRPKVAK